MKTHILQTIAAIFIVCLVIPTLFHYNSENSILEAAQIGSNQVTLNPGGGIETDGSDGLRFTINAEANSNWETPDSAVGGQDSPVYRNTVQYCCSAGSPMLNVGGTLYGQAGPAYSSNQWNSFEILSISGATSIGQKTAQVGTSSAVVRYTVNHNGLVYTVDRTVSYVFPNDFVTDSYSFTIPEGNIAEVKFYLGGDTAPGSSDVGYGIMLTTPVRSVISLNTSSQIMFGFREVVGSKQFDGATSQSFYTPYAIVQSGSDIGFVGTASNHDAGLMMQWDLGATPGIFQASMEQFVTQQGTNLNAVFGSEFADVNEAVQLDISIANTNLSTVSNLGYTFTLPDGLLISEGGQTNSCGGTLTAILGTNIVTLSSGNVGSATNCISSVLVSSTNPGKFTISNLNATDLSSVTNNIGTSSLSVGVYTLSFISQGGSSVSDIVAEVGETVALQMVPTRIGFVFQNWNTSYDGSGTAYSPGANYIMPSSSTQLYAIWDEAETYTLTFDERGGTSVSNTSGFQDSVITLPSAPERTGFSFLNWNTSERGNGVAYEAESNYTVPGNNITLYAIWDDTDGILFSLENEGPNNGDANNDGFLDSEQPNVASFLNSVSNERIVLEVSNTCNLDNVSTNEEQTDENKDSGYTYNNGFISFTANCTGIEGMTIDVSVYYYNENGDDLTLRKYNPNTNAYFTIDGAAISNQTIHGYDVVVATYQITDGGLLDIDGLENGIIIDPVGLGTQSIGVPNTGIGGKLRNNSNF